MTPRAAGRRTASCAPPPHIHTPHTYERAPAVPFTASAHGLHSPLSPTFYAQDGLRPPTTGSALHGRLSYVQSVHAAILPAHGPPAASTACRTQLLYLGATAAKCRTTNVNVNTNSTLLSLRDSLAFDRNPRIAKPGLPPNSQPRIHAKHKPRAVNTAVRCAFASASAALR